MKLENLLYDENRVIKVCDMGFAQIKPKDENIQEAGGKVRGSAPYIAPEVWEGKAFNESADVYSFGIILWEFLMRKRAFLDMLEEMDEEEDWTALFARRVVLEHVRPDIPDTCPVSLRELIVACWNGTPAHRPTFREIVNRLDQVKPSNLNHYRSWSNPRFLTWRDHAFGSKTSTPLARFLLRSFGSYSKPMLATRAARKTVLFSKNSLSCQTPARTYL